MIYQAKKFNHLAGLKGFSDKALNLHLKLYQGYVDNTNKLLEKTSQALPGTPEYAELKRRLGWEFNGMRLHEIYFDSLAQKPRQLSPQSLLMEQFGKDFGSLEKWQTDFKATALSRGIGWTILYWDPIGKKLFNVWIEQHHSGHLAGLKPILPLDMFEHAFLIDWGTDKEKYLSAFFNSLDYAKIGLRVK